MFLCRIAVFAACVFPVVSADAAPPNPEKSDLFTSGTGGYELYRIPGLVVTKQRTLLAYCEARKTARGDWGPIDILLRRSVDKGLNWSDPKRVAEVPGPHLKNPVAVAQNLAAEGTVTYNNPTAIVDAQTGAVHMLFCLEYMRCFYIRSDDDGLTFSEPVEITTTFDQFQADYAWQVLATGPAHGIQLQSGRLLVPVWLSKGTGGHAHRPSVVATIFSDDSGRTWQRGEFVAGETDPLVNPSETVAVQLSDGRVMLNIRSESKHHRRAVSFSADGATDWTVPMFDAALLEPICMAGICRLTSQPQHSKNRLLFSNPHNLEKNGGPGQPGAGRDRRNLSVKLSYDEGATWEFSKTLELGMSGYSDLAVSPDGTIFCFYERSTTDGKSPAAARTLTLAKFSLEWLTDERDSLTNSDPR